MKHSATRQFHRQINNKEFRSSVPKNPEHWPESWKHVSFKEYPRAQQIPLIQQTNISLPPLNEVLLKRKSEVKPINKAITLEKVSALLTYSCGINWSREFQDVTQSRRYYPSGGALYPLEIYLYVRQTSEIEDGVYHYNVLSNTLEKMFEDNQLELLNTALFGQASESPINIFITTVWKRTFQKYGDFGYQLILLEAGHVTQNLLLVATSLGLSASPSMSFDATIIEDVLDLTDADEESVLYSISLAETA